MYKMLLLSYRIAVWRRIGYLINIPLNCSIHWLLGKDSLGTVYLHYHSIVDWRNCTSPGHLSSLEQCKPPLILTVFHMNFC